MEHKNVFISYSSKDQETAFNICNLLEAEGISCWIAPRNVTGGKSYGREILEAISNADVTLFIFSGNSNRSRHVENEIDNAFNAGKVIIPFKIEEVQISLELQYYLNKTHWINGSPTPENAISNLKKAIEANLPQPTKSSKINDLLEMFDKKIASFDAQSPQGKQILKKLHSMKAELQQFIQQDTDAQNDAEFERLLNEFIQNELKADGEPETPGKEASAASPDEAGCYDMLQNGAGEILIIIKHHKSEPYMPRLVYDGEDMALLYRNRESAVMLNSIDEKARQPLASVDEVLVVEVEDDDVAREYKVPVRHVKSLAALMK